MSDNAVMTSGHPEKSGFSTAKALERRVWGHIEANKVREAISGCEQLNREHPDFAPGWHTASQIALKMNRLPMAIESIDKALAIEPGATPWLLHKALCVSKLGDAGRLKTLVNELLRRPMTTAYQCSTLALLMTELGMREKAVALYEKAAKLQPQQSKHYYNIACLQRSLGDIENSERNFDRAVELDPSDYEAYKIRSELRTQTPDNNHIDALRQLLERGIADPRGKTNVCYALAKELEDIGNAKESFRYLKMGADSRRSVMRYDVKRDLDTIAAIQGAFSAAVFERSHGAHDSAEPIFIVGMPRTGTTLVERILSSHSDVFAAGELTNFAVQMMNLVRSQSGDAKPSRDDMVRLTTALDFGKLGKAYIDSTRPFTGHTARFVDKLPLNYLYIGLIHLALPNAKIINLVRHPLDTCYAIYKQLFVDAYPFSYDLVELGKYYVAYDRLMRHWDHVLPGVVYKLSYENLVADFEFEARRLLDHCELDWEPQCLMFHENREASTTASTVQVRQPVYQSSVGKWKLYRNHLEPVVKVLRDGGITLDD